MVPACPKYISGKLRSFSKNFSKNFFHTTLFENFLPTDASVANSKNQPSQGLGTPQNRPWAEPCKKITNAKVLPEEICSEESFNGLEENRVQKFFSVKKLFRVKNFFLGKI